MDKALERTSPNLTGAMYNSGDAGYELSQCIEVM
jgi:hypothetical protein